VQCKLNKLETLQHNGNTARSSCHSDATDIYCIHSYGVGIVAIVDVAVYVL